MARRFRLYGKKRGDRRTGSRRLGSFGEAIFFGVLLLIGSAGLYLLLSGWILPEWQANRHFAPTECVVLDKKVGSNQRDGSTLYRPELRIRYEVDGRTYTETAYDATHLYSLSLEETEEILEDFQIGKTYRCWYDPIEPELVVLVRGYSWWMWLLLILPASFVIFGALGAIHAVLQTGASAERRAALAQKAAHLDLFDDGAERGIDYPNVPRKVHITDSPGTQLAYRLPLDASPGWKLLGIILLSLLWNGIVVWLVVDNVRGHLAGDGQWLMTVLLVPFVAMGVALLYFTARQLLLTTGAGATRVEISGHPLIPGKQYDVCLSQTGWLKMKSLELSLVCDEVATYRQGTDTRTETRRVYTQRVYQSPSIELEPEQSFEDTCRLHVPEEAMHSFHAGHNEVKWKLVVRGDIGRWSNHERRFPVVVYPPEIRSS